MGRKNKTITTDGGLDHERKYFSFFASSKYSIFFAAKFLVLSEIEVSAIVNPLELGPTHREFIFDIFRRNRVVSALVVRMRMKA